MAPLAVRVEGGFGSCRWFVYIATLLLREASWLQIALWDTRTPASAPSILWFLLEPHLEPNLAQVDDHVVVLNKFLSQPQLSDTSLVLQRSVSADIEAPIGITGIPDCSCEWVLLLGERRFYRFLALACVCRVNMLTEDRKGANRDLQLFCYLKPQLALLMSWFWTLHFNAIIVVYNE